MNVLCTHLLLHDTSAHQINSDSHRGSSSLRATPSCCISRCCCGTFVCAQPLLVMEVISLIVQNLCWCERKALQASLTSLGARVSAHVDAKLKDVCLRLHYTRLHSTK